MSQVCFMTSQEQFKERRASLNRVCKEINVLNVAKLVTSTEMGNKIEQSKVQQWQIH